MTESPIPPTAPPQQALSTPEPPPAGGKATASLVLGLCSLFLWVCPFIGLGASITGLVLGIQSQSRRPSGMAKAGIILCALGLLAALVNAAIGVYLQATGQNPLADKLLDIL